MTESDWLSASQIYELTHYKSSRSDRKRRLLACAATRRLIEAHSDPRLDAAISGCEQFADRAASWQDMLEIRRSLRSLQREMAAIHSDVSDLNALRAVLTLIGREFVDYRLALEAAQHHRGHRPRDYVEGCREEEQQQIHLARDIFGNPFRPVAFSPEWRTSTVVSLAQGMYESRDFTPMPLLADSLQDAGCEHEDILAHCRDANGTHVRGCWVVDGVLGKS